ncbi:KamA family radical SAM protein [Desulfopila inferna]|uniref:KamA family radical SAM protein n=1 Tax=Desulfopila inferna TaxID=468528 RepID=UPI001964CF91|nr:KamA family radical SAM protein [Desulfopila inferna]MBM9605475.1 KamA family radical SAM protein [Desulfopila inferna]
MEPQTRKDQDCHNALDKYTLDLIAELSAGIKTEKKKPADAEVKKEISQLFQTACKKNLTNPIIQLFQRLQARRDCGNSIDDFGLTKKDLCTLALKHQQIDEHMVSLGGRLTQALPIASRANARVEDYLERKDREAPSGIELWDTIQENAARIRRQLRMSEEDWFSYKGQIRNCITSADQLALLIDLPEEAIASVARVTQSFRMRLTPYYTSLILPGQVNDPIMLQSVPTGEMVDNAGIEIPPVAADHSPARLIDQFYPRVLTIKATNMCAMYCTHCLRLAHIGRKDNTYSKEAYGEALDYIRSNKRIRDVLVTGGDAFVLPDSILKWLLGELDSIEHVQVKRLGTRIPITAPMRVDDQLLDILEESNDKKPIRVVTQINTAQEITPLSRDAFRKISKRVFTVLNQAVLLKGINDTRVKMWKLCETIHESYVRPYYIFNCSYRNPQFKHFRVPLEVGRDIVESMYGNISGDAIPRFIATAGGKIPLHRSNVVSTDGEYILRKPWNDQEVAYPDAEPELYAAEDFAFGKYHR